MAWRQCPKRLWLQQNRRDLLGSETQSDQKILIGNEVGELARGMYPEGVLIEHREISAAVAATTSAMSSHPHRAIFEAAFVRDGLAVRADLLLPEKAGYRLVEVKSATGLKPHYLDDCAIQAWVLNQSPVKLIAVELAHINTDFIYAGRDDYDGLFSHHVLNRPLASLIPEVPDWLRAAREVLAGSEPEIETGPQCLVPHECPFRNHCSSGQTEQAEFPLEVFYRMRASLRDELRLQGYLDAREVPESALNTIQQRIQRVCRSGKPELLAGAKEQLAALPYPRYYLDFETITFPIPRWVGTSPYRSQVPFQWSCHVELDEGALRHDGFLDTTGCDPRRAFAESLIAVLGTEGPVFVYNQSFEKTRIAELANLFLDLSPALIAINERVVDLLPITREHYYHPDMKGSWSIKAVLPTIARDLDYGALEVGNGEDAQAAYREVVHPMTSAARKGALINGLGEYCKLDTLAMVRLAWFLQGLPVYLFSLAMAEQKLVRADYGRNSADDASAVAIEVFRQHCISTKDNAIVGPVSLLQRKLRIGYRDAVALLDQLTTCGVLTKSDKP